MPWSGGRAPSDLPWGRRPRGALKEGRSGPGATLNGAGRRGGTGSAKNPASPDAHDVAISRGRSAGGCLSGRRGCRRQLRSASRVREAGRGRGDRGEDGRSVKTFRPAPRDSPGSASASGGFFPAVLGVVRVLASSPGVTAGPGRSAQGGGRLTRVERDDPPPERRDRRGSRSPGGREGVEASGRPATTGAGAWTRSPLPAGVLWASSVRSVRLLWKWPSEIASSHISAATSPGPPRVRKRDRAGSGDSRESGPGPWNCLPDSQGKSDLIRDFRKFRLRKTTESRRPAWKTDSMVREAQKIRQSPAGQLGKPASMVRDAQTKRQSPAGQHGARGSNNKTKSNRPA